jgi:hypothetical protein
MSKKCECSREYEFPDGGVKTRLVKGEFYDGYEVESVNVYGERSSCRIMGIKYCPWCGQRLDWSEAETDTGRGVSTE